MRILIHPTDKPLWDKLKRDMAAIGPTTLEGFYAGGTRLIEDARCPLGYRIVLDNDGRFVNCLPNSGMDELLNTLRGLAP